jgi:hypothetical protein
MFVVLAPVNTFWNMWLIRKFRGDEALVLQVSFFPAALCVFSKQDKGEAVRPLSCNSLLPHRLVWFPKDSCSLQLRSHIFQTCFIHYYVGAST